MKNAKLSCYLIRKKLETFLCNFQAEVQNCLTF